MKRSFTERLFRTGQTKLRKSIWVNRSRSKSLYYHLYNHCTKTKQFAKQSSGPRKTLVNIMNDLYYTKTCEWWCLESKRYVWIKINIIIGYWAFITLSTWYTFNNYSINNNLNNLELIFPKMLKTLGWKQKLGCLIDHPTKNKHVQQ